MPINWNDLDNALQDAIDNATQKTDAKLAGEVSSLTRLTDAEVKKLFPTPADVASLTQLLKIVKGATDHNDKINNLVKNIDDLAGTVITLLEKYA